MTSTLEEKGGGDAVPPEAKTGKEPTPSPTVGSSDGSREGGDSGDGDSDG